MEINPLFWVIPVSFAISFAYTASRYEDQAVIIRRGISFFWKTLAFLGVIFVVLYFLTAGL